jgi:hypothetical protein
MLGSFVQNLAVLTGILFAGLLLARFPVSVALFALALGIFSDLVTWPENTGLEIASVTLYADDVVLLILLAAGIIVAQRSGRLFTSVSAPLVALLSLIVLNVVRGAGENGLKAAGNDARDFAYLIVPAIGFLLLRPALTLTPAIIAKWLICGGTVFSAVAVAHWTGLLPTAELLVETSHVQEVVRVLGAHEAMIIGEALIAILFVQVVNGVTWWSLLLAGSLGVTTIALQHRSVWTALLVGLAWLVFGTFRRYSKPWLQVAAALLIGLTLSVAALMIAGRLDFVESVLTKNIDETQQEDSTWNWRVQGFIEATNRALFGDVIELIVGPPSGRDLGATASVASVHIHNRYVDTFAFYGLIGLFSFLACLLDIAKRVFGWAKPPHAAREDASGLVLVQALHLAQLTYFIAYPGELLQGIVFALTLSASYAPITEPAFREAPTSAQQRVHIPAMQ